MSARPRHVNTGTGRPCDRRPRQAGRMRVAHVITGTEAGGAELMLERLISSSDRKSFSMCVISLTGVGSIGRRLRETGIEVAAAGVPRGRPDPRLPWLVARLLRELRAEAVQTWMYHADLVGGLAARLAGGLPVAWNIRHSSLERGRDRAATLATARLCAILSRTLPRRIVCCSRASLRTHARLGYHAGRMIVIPNGFDTDRFRPDAGARAALRAVLGIGEATPLVGLVARLHAQKDHETFIRAAGILHAARPGARFLLCGEGVLPDHPRLAAWIEAAGVGEAAYLLGLRDDMPAVNASLDLATSSACGGEGFPNVIAEAMSCGVPCVATDAGDSADIVGDTGIVVRPRDPAALAAAWEALLELPAERRAELGRRARERIRKQFALERITALYEDLYRGMLDPAWRPGPRSA